MKAGDYVKCVDAKNCLGQLEEGKVYQIAGEDTKHVKFRDGGGYTQWFYKTRFVPVESQAVLKLGDVELRVSASFDPSYDQHVDHIYRTFIDKSAVGRHAQLEAIKSRLASDQENIAKVKAELMRVGEQGQIYRQQYEQLKAKMVAIKLLT